MKTCSHKGCIYNVFSKGLCNKHWKQQYAKPLKRTPLKKAKPVQMIFSKLFVTGEAEPAKKKIKPIKKVSDKRAKEMQLYLKKRKIFLEQHKLCEANLEICTRQAFQVHHSCGRSNKLLNQEEFWIAICDSCHKKITEDSAMAILNNLSISRHKKRQ